MGEKDLRIVKTLDGIKESFLQCIEEIGFRNMTVKNITQKARINRSTFYKYYSDKYDLRDKYVNSIIDEFVNMLDTQFLDKKELTIADYYEDLKKSLESFYKRKREYILLWNSDLEERNVFMEMIDRGVQKFVDEFTRISDIPKEKVQFYNLYANLFLGNMMVSLKWWFTEGQNISVEVFTKMMIKHMGQSIFYTLKNSEK